MEDARVKEDPRFAQGIKLNSVQQEAAFEESAAAKIIKLSLLHPSNSFPVETWSFEEKPIIKIGRSSDNHVIINSAVVSRHHLGLCREEFGWEIINFGANGTYWRGKLISEVPVVDGMIVCLGGSGPQIQIHLLASGTEPLQNVISSEQSSIKPTGNNSYSTFIRS